MFVLRYLVISYDNTRKTTRSADIKCLDTETNKVHTMSTPAPLESRRLGYIWWQTNQGRYFSNARTDFAPSSILTERLRLRPVPALNIVEMCHISHKHCRWRFLWLGIMLRIECHRLYPYLYRFGMNYLRSDYRQGTIYNVSIDTDANGNLSVEYDPESGEISEKLAIWLPKRLIMIDENWNKGGFLQIRRNWL